jgi:hypothetical protein
MLIAAANRLLPHFIIPVTLFKHSYCSPSLSVFYSHTSVGHRPLCILYTCNSAGALLQIVSGILNKYYYTFFSMTFGRKKPDEASGLIRQLLFKIM